MRSIWLLLALILSPHVNAKTSVNLYTYFDKPPFIVSQSQKSGLSYDLAEALSQYSAKYDYQVLYAPKQRALKQLEDNGALLWVNPAWVDDKTQSKYLWLADLIEDRELYITADSQLTYTDDSSLFNKVLVGVRGYFYFNLNKHLQTESIKRTDVRSENLIPKMLIKNRGDFGVIGFQTYFYLVKNNPDYLLKLRILENYKNYFTRSIAVSNADPDIKKEITAFMQTKAWDSLFHKWLTVMQ